MSTAEKARIQDMLFLLKGDDVFEQRTTVQGLLTRLENKSGVLLTHISMMAAVTGVLMGIQSTTSNVGVGALNHRFLAIDFIAYLILAVLCVRCQFHFDSSHARHLKLLKIEDIPRKEMHPQKPEMIRGQNRNVLELEFQAEVVYREGLFRFCLFGLYFLTISLAVVLAFAVFKIDVFESGAVLFQWVAEKYWAI